MKLRHGGIAVIKQQLNFHHFIDIRYVALSFAILMFWCPTLDYIQGVLKFEIFSKSRKKIAIFSTHKIK